MKTKQELTWCFLVLLDIKPRITLFKDTHIVRNGHAWANYGPVSCASCYAIQSGLPNLMKFY